MNNLPQKKSQGFDTKEVQSFSSSSTCRKHSGKTHCLVNHNKKER